MVNDGIADEWLKWMLDIHLPEILGTGCFTRHQVLRLADTGNLEGPTFAFQYYAESKADYNRYMELYRPGLSQQQIKVWGDQFIAFSTLMEVIH